MFVVSSAMLSCLLLGHTNRKPLPALPNEYKVPNFKGMNSKHVIVHTKVRIIKTS
jgi:hypothetical protein